MKAYPRRPARPRMQPPGPMTGTPLQIAWAREIYRRLLRDHVRIRENCDVLALLTDRMTGRELTEWYLDHVGRRQRRAVWWIAHRNDLSSAWFMEEYISRYLNQNTAQPAPVSENACMRECLLTPEQPAHPGAVELISEPDDDNPACGLCMARYEKNSAFGLIMSELRMTWDPQRRMYVRRISGPDAPLPDRCAEIGSRLLMAGFRIYVPDEAVMIAICTGRFSWGYDRWILPGCSPTMLDLVFPKDQALYRRACSLGAHWNGKSIEINLLHAEELLDFARLYEFRISSEARKMIDSWLENRLQGVVVRPNPPTLHCVCEDPVQRILLNNEPVPEDLIDEN